MPQKTGRKPSITISETDYERLSGLAEALEDRNPEISETMMAELDRARVVRDSALAGTVVRMGSTLTYTADAGEPKTVTLVYPGDADIEQGRISITTPVGTALLGLKEGQSIDWAARNGQIHRLTVLTVNQTVESA
ncbi:nucleoside diphosphate kinase regulator [Nitratireductor pacificus]|uniref:Nucleoside diphosphate kinase regulator n=1 Tax=Nitratireductor pacificus pht-3B TaxID=391937 RepID=K2M8T7_9HYPH|nr:nucleoside diphosphate kinase regulator [Nitratireductor pacificus]EKF17430.1 nucleoside diphosphate kinase regulator [Nitratireductor pacificus pht-3B]